MPNQRGVNMAGSITVIVGPMFSGKSYELIRLINVARIAGKVVHVYKPPDRHRSKIIKSRDGNETKTKILNVGMNTEQYQAAFMEGFHYWDPVVSDFDAVLPEGGPPDIIAIDEVQFYDNETLPAAIQKATDAGISFILSGLSRDFGGKPFGAMASLLWMADEIIPLI